MSGTAVTVPGPAAGPWSAQLSGAAAQLRDAGTPAALAARHARVLARLVAGRAASAPLPATATAAQAQRLGELVARRCAGEPLQYVLGSVPWRRLELLVGPGVFIPRPETELMVDLALDALDALDALGVPGVPGAGPRPGDAGEGRAAGGRTATGGLTVVDLCAGSGAVALALATETGAAQVPVTVHAVELDPGAVAWLQRNVAAVCARGGAPGTTPLVVVSTGDATAATTLAHLDGTVDVVTANPPYLPDGLAVPAEVADHEPQRALWGGPDGTAVVRRVLHRAAALLRPGGTVVVEHHDSDGAPHRAAAAAADAGFTAVRTEPDLTGRPRFVVARRPS